MLSKQMEIFDNISRAYSAKPFVKWVGGKSSIIENLMLVFGEFNGYWEPFVGGGSVFFELYRRGWRGFTSLSDANAALMNCYLEIRDSPEEIISLLKGYGEGHSEEQYYQVRESFNKELEYTKRAAMLIYLNRTCFNGLYRVNKRGRFNVPVGSYKNPLICDAENLRRVAHSLRIARIGFNEFYSLLISPHKGDLVYCDPPYDEMYTSYTARGFTREDQEHLREECERWIGHGVKVIVSNNDTAFIRDLYRGWVLHEVHAKHVVSRDSGSRGRKPELLMVSRGARGK